MTVQEPPLLLDAVDRTPPPSALRASLTLKSREFRKGREAGWQDLERLIGRIEKHGVKALALDELQRLPLLYRAAISSLSVARAIALDRHLLLYLENLTLRAYLAVYGPRVSLREEAAAFLARGLPEAVRGARWHIALAILALLIGTVAGFLLVQADEAWFSSIIPASLAGGRGPESTRAQLLDDEIFGPPSGFAEALLLFANFLFSHNSMVGILCFSLGMAAGVPTLLLLAYQGLTLGAFVALHANRGLTVEILGWLSIHGVTELSAIVLCGAAGLVLAEKALFPGRYGRMASLAHHGRDAARIAVGAVMMLLVAAILEGGFRQLVASTPWRFVIGGATGLTWLLYFLRGSALMRRWRGRG
jgi:uncharacterized membrane protein SpoIIM required for sporulation